MISWLSLIYLAGIGNLAAAGWLFLDEDPLGNAFVVLSLVWFALYFWLGGRK